jgi:hypothetical protein
MGQDGRSRKTDLPDGEREIFLQMGLDELQNSPSGKSVRSTWPG